MVPTMPKAFSEFLLNSRPADLPEDAFRMAKRCLLDLLGVAAAGSQTDLAHIITAHAGEQFAAGNATASIPFTARSASPTGAAFAGGMMIDSVDAHDGQLLCKGHVGCGLFPSLLAMAEATGLEDGSEFLARLILGYEIGSRAGIALHASVPDYHTSGAWIAVTCAGLGARALELNEQAMRHAIGIAEYHGPRSQMMRAIDHPTMVKDGSGFGAMAGTSAAYLAASGFTGAPAITVEGADVTVHWADLGERWMIHEQYFKPYPVCYWAQAPIAAALSLLDTHPVQPDEIEHVECVSFHEAIRLAAREPKNTEQAQYSLPFPVASAIVHGSVGPEEVRGESLSNPETLRLSRSVKLAERDDFNDAFPARRFAAINFVMKDGTRLESDDFEPVGIPQNPLSDSDLDTKYLNYAGAVMGNERAEQLMDTVSQLEKPGYLHQSHQATAGASCRLELASRKSCRANDSEFPDFNNVLPLQYPRYSGFLPPL